VVDRLTAVPFQIAYLTDTASRGGVFCLRVATTPL